jgi:hypothetical protein
MKSWTTRFFCFLKQTLCISHPDARFPQAAKIRIMKMTSKLIVTLTLGTFVLFSRNGALAQTPEIISQPASQSVEVGAAVAFSVVATGSDSLAYIWRFNALEIADATNSVLTIPYVQAEHAGYYDVIVSSLDGTVSSDIATLTVTNTSIPEPLPPTIESQPASQSVVVGGSVLFSVTATGGEALSYIWRFNTLEIPDATNSVLEMTNVQPEQAGSYDVIVSNPDGSVTSDIATLSVTNPLPPAETFLDFNDDGKADLLWVHSSGTIAAWFMDGTNLLSASVLSLVAPADWRMAGQADFDKDGNLDWLWHHPGGALQLWLMDGTNQLGILDLHGRTNGGWRVSGLADFNDDGNTDILWHHGNGTVSLWLFEGTTFKEAMLLNEGKRTRGGWKVAAVLDVDVDGSPDIVWQHGGGRIFNWFMDGTTILRTEEFRFERRTANSWKVVSTTDLNGDGRGDLIWQHPSGSVAVTLLTEAGRFSAPLRNGRPVKPGWSVGETE